MKFFFCEKCGRRLTDQDLASGQARDKQVKGVHCKDCATGVMTMTFEALSDSQAHDLLKLKTPQPAQPPIPAPPAKPPTRESQTRLAPAFRKSAPKPPASAPHSKRTLWLAMGIAALLVLGVGMLALSSKPAPALRKPEPPAAASAQPLEKPVLEPAAQPVPPPNAPAEKPKVVAAQELPAPAEPPALPAFKQAEQAPKKPKPPAAKVGPDGLLVQLKFDGDLADSGPLSLQANTGNRAPNFQAGIHGQALVIADPDKANAVVLARHKALYESTQFGVAFWLRVDAPVGRGVRMINNHVRWSLNIKPKSLALGLRGGKQEAEFALPKLLDGGWHHLALSWDGKAAQCWFDGAAQTAQPVEGVDLLLDMTWSISAMGTPWNGCLVGAMDDFRLYNRPLTAAEAAELAKR